VAGPHCDGVGLTSTRIRHVNATDLTRRAKLLQAYRLADACDHAELIAKPEIGRSDSSARLPSSRSSCIEPARTI
jgi:hypothetical protein